MREIDKSFGPIVAERGASIEVAAGEIHALVGENGAGKSTLMRIASGSLLPDAGRIEVFGHDVTGWNIADAIAAGVGMVYQHFMLVPTLTVAENVVLGREPTRGALFDAAEATRAVEALGQATGLTVRPDRLAADLTVGEAQRVEILKVLYRGARLVILDEPTAVLSPPEVDHLWTVLRAVRASGGTVVLITHKLDEVMAISDSVTVMRDGRTVARLATASTTPAVLAHLMVGRDLAPTPPFLQSPRVTSAPALEIIDLVVQAAHGARAVDGVSVVVHSGEILGIAGVEGNGQTELIEAIAGLRAATSGEIWLDGARIDTLSVRARAERGLSHIPEDRHRRGLVLDYSTADNLILGLDRQFARPPFGLRLDRAAIDAHARGQIEAFDIRPPDPARPARTLSGGNQQKIVVAREAGPARQFTTLLAAQPTHGVDVGAIETIHAHLRAARDAGRAILLVSSELQELLALADRIAVMLRGRIVATLARDDATIAALGSLMSGAT
jgi:general nucleoside transport system ATP-binding protein